MMKEADMPRTTQLRAYTIREGLLDEWAVRWRDLVVPLRLELGFEIGGAWVDYERSQFIWLITYEGDDTFEEANRRYWASPRREALGLDPADYLIARDVRAVEAVQ
ncbi:NIPSNAP family containing protein [Nocardia cyriacigeorgica]|uniref:NIPSNAP family containing protein n=2 Tax=Nocardia cyriacigeorgica TaxID=135487 RepID=UPI001E4FD890|nr:NIPSNAP family containing protein [Nocardia cyriacigeorgica]